MGVFHLKLSPLKEQPGRFSVSCEGAHEEITFPPAGQFTTQVEHVHERGGSRLMSLVEQEKVTDPIGLTLFNTVFVGSVRDRFIEYRKTEETPRLGIHLPRTLFAYPWELLRDAADPPTQFLSLNGSVIRYDDDALSSNDAVYQPLADNAPFLFMLVNIAGKLAIGSFVPPAAGKLKFVTIDPTYDAFFKGLAGKTPPAGLVFFGHGEVKPPWGSLFFAKYEIQDGWRYPKPDPRTAAAICVDIGPKKTFRIAGLFACESAWIAKNPPLVEFPYTVAGAVLERTHAAYVIAAQNEIHPVAAYNCLVGWSAELAERTPLDLALSAGRRRIYTSGDEELATLDWWIPVLYAKTTSFDVLPEPSPLALPPLVGRGEALPRPPPADAERDIAALVGAAARRLVNVFTSDRSRRRLQDLLPDN